MIQRTMHVFLGLVFIGLMGVQSVWAASFGRIDVASYLGEPFYAEVPLNIGGNEKLNKISVEIGSSSDYRILEVYRNKIVDSIRTDVVDDERGSRVELSAEYAIDEAFFNLILKVRYGRSTHYKKMPILLESGVSRLSHKPEKVASVNIAAIAPETSDAFVTKLPEGSPQMIDAGDELEIIDIADIEPAVDSPEEIKAYAGWSRTSRYGPMIYGDTITTVAQRLRLDSRFTNQQVMIALFEKNKEKFGKNNINLIRAGSYLDVPTAEEVSQISSAEAKQLLAQQAKAWKTMVKQPKYAAVADAQRTRYSKRIRVGQEGTGILASPVEAPSKAQEQPKAEAVEIEQPNNEVNNKIEKKLKRNNAGLQTELKTAKASIAQKDSELSALQRKMEAMAQKLAKAEEKADGSVKEESPKAKPDLDTTGSAALEAQSKRLEIVISRLKNELEQAKSEASSGETASDWVTYVVSGLALLVLALLISVVLLLRREPKHPADQAELDGTEQDALLDTNQFETFDAEGIETKLMNADEFEMPSDDTFSDLDEADAQNMFGDVPLEDIPELTDEETGEMEPFNADVEGEMPDTNVDYLEEADVYLRYGMEEEAEQQVQMALKVQKDNPAAHAKLVKIYREKGDAAAEGAAMTAAKEILSGDALDTFELLLLSDDGDVSDEASSSDSSEDTGMVDFGEMSLGGDASDDDQAMDFEAPKDDSESDAMLSDSSSTDTGILDFGEINFADENKESASEEDAIDFDFSDIGSPSDNQSDEVLNDQGIEASEAEEADLQPSVAVQVQALPEAEKSIGLDDFQSGILESFDADNSLNFEVSGEFSSIDDDIDAIESMEINLDSIELESTAAVEVDDQTVSPSLQSMEIDIELNDREIAQNLAKAEEEANAVSVDLDFEVEDPFAVANDSLIEADSGELSVDFDDVDLLASEDDELLSLSKSDPDIDSEDLTLTGLAGEESFDSFAMSGDLSEEEVEQNLEEQSEVENVSDQALAEDDSDLLLTFADNQDPELHIDSIEMPSDSADAGQVEDIVAVEEITEGRSLNEHLIAEDEGDMAALPTDDFDSSSDLGEASAALDLDDLDLDGFMEEDSEGSLSEALPDLDAEIDASMILNQVESDMEDVIGDPVIENNGDSLSEALPDLDADLDASMILNQVESDMDEAFGDSMIENNGESLSEALPDLDADLDASMILDQVQADLEDVIGGSVSNNFSSLDDALDATVLMGNNPKPMGDEFSATSELNSIELEMGTLTEEKQLDAGPEQAEKGLSSELDDLMDDLNSLLDEDDLKK